jgi:hypothetical protein
MATQKFTCPVPASGEGTFSDGLVGLQLIDGGGFTQANFAFTTSIAEKQNRTFNIGTFSDPISLETLSVQDVDESRIIALNNFRVYPNYDLSQVTNFTQWGSLVKRFSVSITKIINYFPAALEVSNVSSSFLTNFTATNIIYEAVEDDTTFDIPIGAIRNPFDIDFTVNADRNIQLLESPVSPLRNMKANYRKYSLFINGNSYPVNYIIPTNDNSTVLTIGVDGNPFNGQQNSSDYLVIRPNDMEVTRVFIEDFDQVENFLLNRKVTPIYTSSFVLPVVQDDGNYKITNASATFPLNGKWNLDILSANFDNYLEQINTFAVSLDEYKTNLVSRFLTTGAFKEFDTQDQKVEKVLQIYGRSFDETTQFISALANMNNVNYNVGNDIPSQLLKNLAQTLGWKTNFSPITNEQLLTSVFQPQTNLFPGVSVGPTPEELNYQFYRNIILNSAYLFKAKGTRKSVECLLRLVGAPESLIEFNEFVYVADQRINMSDFDQQFLQISGGTLTTQIPVLQTDNVFSIQGVQYTGFTTQSISQRVLTLRGDYPVDVFGCPTMPETSDTYFFQIGGGWFQSTPAHRMPEAVVPTNNVFTGDNPNYQTELLPFNYGEEYLQRYRSFPYMNIGYKIRKIQDNKKSWATSNSTLRANSDGGFNARYVAEEDCLVINVKNVDIFMNPAQGIAYNIWEMSRLYNYPIPEQGLFYTPPSPCDTSNPYPRRGGIDWTVIVPKPKQKTFFEFAQTFWKNMINVRNRQFITDGKTGGYPTLQSIFWNYLQSEQKMNIPNDNFTYQTLIDYVNGMGQYWIQLVEQMIPATTLWQAGTRYENSIFHRQKYVWRRQYGCRTLPVPCNPCSLTSELFVYDCPGQIITCGLYPWNNDPAVTSFGVVLNNSLQTYINLLGLTCNLPSVTTDWYIDLRINGVQVAQTLFYTGYGTLDVPTNSDYVNGLQTALISLQTSGYDYYIDNTNSTVSVFNNNCTTVFDDFQINIGLDFEIFCNG